MGPLRERRTGPAPLPLPAVRVEAERTASSSAAGVTTVRAFHALGGVVPMPLYWDRFPGVLVLHPKTFHIGLDVFIGSGTYLQGRHDGRFVVGKGTWIGPQCFLDCRDLEIEEYVGIGPGVKILG